MKKYILVSVVSAILFAASNTTALAEETNLTELSQQVSQLQLQLTILQLQAELASLQSMQSPRISVSLDRLQRDLSLGSTGDDVRLLQQFLNQNSRTRVAQSGPGSPGNETVTFGERTRQALMQYKIIHNLQSEFVPLDRLDARTRSHMRLSLRPVPAPSSQATVTPRPPQSTANCQNGNRRYAAGDTVQSILESGNTIAVRGAAFRCSTTGAWETVQQTSAGEYEKVQAGCSGLLDSRLYPVGAEITGSISGGLEGRASCQSTGWDIRLR